MTSWNKSTIKKMINSKKIKRKFSPTELTFSIKIGKTKVSGIVTTKKEAILGVEYRGPLNESFFCYNTSIGNLVLTVEIDGEQKEYTIENSVAFETVHDKPLEGYSCLKWEQEFLE